MGPPAILTKKTENEILKLVSLDNLLKFLVGKDTIRNILSFQLASIS